MTPIDDFSDIKPKGAEKLPRDKFNVPKTIKEINMSEVNLHGINETNDVLKFLCDAGAAISAALADDGKITFSDAPKFFKPAGSVIKAISGIDKVPAELADKITDEEKEILKKTVIESGVLEGDAEAAVTEGLDLAVALKNYIFKHFVKTVPAPGI